MKLYEGPLKSVIAVELVLYQGKNVRVTVEFKVPKRHILRPTLSTNMVLRVLLWERKKSCYSKKKEAWPDDREMLL
jgi:hypothetical protein